MAPLRLTTNGNPAQQRLSLPADFQNNGMDSDFDVQSPSSFDGPGDLVKDQPKQKEFTVRSTLALMGAFMALFCTLGFQNAFGVLQEFYFRYQLKGHSEFDIAWIGSLLTFLLFFCAAPAGVLTDRVGSRPLLIAGSIGTILSIFMTSLCTQYYQFLLAQGILMGASAAFLLTPAMATVSHMFDRHRSAATGIMIAGSSVGGILWPIMLNQLLNSDGVSFGWSFRYVAFVVLGLSVFIVLTVRLPPAPQKQNISTEMIVEEKERTPEEIMAAKKAQKEAELAIIKNPTFLLLCGGLSVATFGLFTPIFYLPTYAVGHGLTTSLAFYLISMLNGASFFGRITTGFLADRFGNFNLCFLTIASTGIIAMCWTKATTTAGIIVFTIAYGFTSGAMFSLQSPCAVQLATPASRGAAVGLLFVAPAIPGLVGSPIGGRLIARGYLAVSMYAGACLLAGALIVLVARLRLSRKLLARV